MPIHELLDTGNSALADGRWTDARAAFEACLAHDPSPDACMGLAVAQWWMGENRESVVRCAQAYAWYRRSGNVEHAVRCAVWLAITYKANFANTAAANGWIGRAERLLATIDPGPLHGWTWIARAYRMSDLAVAEDLTMRAVAIGRAAGDVDLELVALAQLGLIRVARGETAAGFALIDEAVAAALAGERTSLDTVVYTCCDMLNACELVSDLRRAAQWCQVADEFLDTVGCPFLYAECRIYFGSVLAATGQWARAERELASGLRITRGACPGLHMRALNRLAQLRIRQGRLEEAEQLMAALDPGTDDDAEIAMCVAALQLARGDAGAAARTLEHRIPQLDGRPARLVAALDLVVEAHVAVGDLDAAERAIDRLDALSSLPGSDHVDAAAAESRGRVAVRRGDVPTAVSQLESALGRWSEMTRPFEAARTRFELSRALADAQPELAVAEARRSLAGFESLGAPAHADRVAVFLRSLGHTPRTGPKGLGTLTSREADVLRLLGVGLTNPEIAARLYISRKTAAHHVSRILTKLGLRNRAEAAAFATRMTDSPDDP